MTPTASLPTSPITAPDLAGDTSPASLSPDLVDRFARRLGIELTVEQAGRLAQAIVTVASGKGGVGKTRLAYEIAWFLEGVLVDLEWDGGSASKLWGYRWQDRTTAPLLDALESGRVPRPLKGGSRRPALVPGHPDFEPNQPEADAFAGALERWQATWKRPMVVDSHPGGSPSTYGAIKAARLVVVPAPLAHVPMNALGDFLEELPDYPMLLIPSMVPAYPPETMIRKLETLSEKYNVPVGPAVSHWAPLERRQRSMAVAAAEPTPKASAKFAGEIEAVVKAVISHVVAG